MIRVRVLFLKQGDIAAQTDFDGCLTPEIEEPCCAENLEHEYWKLCPHELAEGLHHLNFAANDPGVSVLRDCILVYFDLLTLNADWMGSGGIGESVENAGLWETFQRWLPDLIAHAWVCRGKRKPVLDGQKPYGPDGTRVQFLTLWRYWTTSHSSPNYGEEWDSDYDLIGTFEPGEEPRPLHKLQAQRA